MSIGKNKKDYDKIIKNLHNLKNHKTFTNNQKKWTSYIYHFSDINNVKKILIEEALYSRNELEKQNKEFKNSADNEIINKTSKDKKNFVRLYFRPRTPTQYRNEGIRSKVAISSEAHCPVPIFLIFNAKEILIKENTYFSNGNIASGSAIIDNTTGFYLNLPFNSIYHDSSLYGFEENEKAKIIFHKNAEILILKNLDLSQLRFICCRSNAEFESLIHFLPNNIKNKWKMKIGICKRPLFYFAKWLFIENVNMNSHNIEIIFNKSEISNQKYKFTIYLKDLIINKTYSKILNNYSPQKKFTMSLKSINNPINYEIEIYINNDLIYSNIYNEDSEIPF